MHFIFFTRFPDVLCRHAGSPRQKHYRSRQRWQNAKRACRFGWKARGQNYHQDRGNIIILQ